jgi:hypothetical protein
MLQGVRSASHCSAQSWLLLLLSWNLWQAGHRQQQLLGHWLEASVVMVGCS